MTHSISVYNNNCNGHFWGEGYCVLGSLVISLRSQQPHDMGCLILSADDSMETYLVHTLAPGHTAIAEQWDLCLYIFV